MTGLRIMTEEEKRKMWLDACDPGRRVAFGTARRLIPESPLMEWDDVSSPRIHVTDD